MAGDLRVKFIPILPKRGLDYPLKDHAEFLAKTRTYLTSRAKPLLKEELKQFTDGWSTRVDFVGRVTTTPDTISILVFPRGSGRNIWIWVSDGTRARTITAKRAPSLRFRTGYRPHTTPRGRKGGPGIASGPWATPQSVNWPGIKARNFETRVKEKEENRIQQEIEAIFRSVYQI